jgi:hypothetical protein
VDRWVKRGAACLLCGHWPAPHDRLVRGRLVLVCALCDRRPDTDMRLDEVVREGHEDQHWHRVDFWAAVERNLNRAGITDAERKKIVADLQSAVPKPDAKSRAASNRELTRQEDRQKRGR